MTDLTNLRILVCTTPIKMNLSFDGLMGMAQETFDQDPRLRAVEVGSACACAAQVCLPLL